MATPTRWPNVPGDWNVPRPKPILPLAGFTHFNGMWTDPIPAGMTLVRVGGIGSDVTLTLPRTSAGGSMIMMFNESIYNVNIQTDPADEGGTILVLAPDEHKLLICDMGAHWAQF